MSERIEAGRVVCEHRKMAIVAAAPSRAAAPWADPAWCFQLINEIPQKIYHRAWEMHPRSVQSEQDMAWLRRNVAPCYVLDPEEWDGAIANPVRYPLDAVLALPGIRDCFGATFTYQVALAIVDGFEEIGLWGMSLAQGTLRERTVERASLNWWLGYAAGRGVKVTLENDVTWTHPGRYGYSYHAEKRAVELQMDDLRAYCRHEELARR